MAQKGIGLKETKGGLQTRHPLVSLLFWALGQDMQKGEQSDSQQEAEEAAAMNDPLKDRTLSWKDEKINGAPLTTTNTWIDDFGEVEAPDVPLKGPEEFKGPLKPKVLQNKDNGARSSSTDSSGGGSPGGGGGSPNNWGFFVSITPPQSELYGKASTSAAGPSL